MWTTVSEVTNYGDCSNTSVDEIEDNDWILELEDIEKDSGRILFHRTKSERDIKGVRHPFCKGNILYSKLRTYLNKVLVAETNGFCTTEIIPFSVYGGICPNYICHVLRSEYFLEYTKMCGYGVKMPRLSTTDAQKGLIPLPPINEQIRIIENINKWFESIDALENDRNSLEEVIIKAKSKILDLAIHGKLVPQDSTDEPAIELLGRINPKFTPCDNGQYGQIPKTWLSVPLEALFDVNPKSKLEDKMEVGFVPMELVADGYSGTHSFESRKWAEVKKGYCHFANGDIGVAKISPCFENLKSTLFDNLPNGHGAGTTELVIMRNKGIHPKFYLYLFKSNWYIAQGTKYFKGVVGQQRVNREIFTTLHVPLPPLAEQHRIVARIEELFATLDKIQNSLEA